MRNKNISFPVMVRTRDSNENQLIGVEKIDYIAKMVSFEKQDQYLFFYNATSEKRIERINNFVRTFFVKGKKRFNQTTLVIDFDDLVPSIEEKIESSFEEFSKVTGGKPIILKSPSGGRHVLYVVNGAITEEMYKRLQKGVINTFFSECSAFVDEGSTYSLMRGFYHSQHMHHWINIGRINTTPAKQIKNGFWDHKYTLKITELLNLIDIIQPTPSRNIRELAYDADVMINFLHHLCKSTGAPDAEKERNCDRFIRIMAEIRCREEETVKKYTKEICNRAQAAEYKAAFECIEGFACKAILRTEAVPEIRRELAYWDGSSRSRSNEETNGQDFHATSEGGIFRVDSQSSGHGDCSVSGDDRAERIGHRTDSGLERLLGTLQDLRNSVEARCPPDKKLGDVFRKNALRSNSNWDASAKESDIRLYDELLREAMDRDPRIARDLGTAPERHYLWLINARPHLRSQDKSLRVLQKFTSDAARCVRLCLTAQNVKINLVPPLARNTVSREEAIGFIEKIETNLPDLMIGISTQNRLTLHRLLKTEKEFVISGTQAFLTRIKEHYPLILRGESISIGLLDFESFFKTHVQRATSLRTLFMNYCSTEVSDYIPHVKRRSFKIDLMKISDIFHRNVKIPNTPLELANLIGSGRTWESFCKYLPAMYGSLGVSLTKELWYTALDASNANDKEARKKDVERFLEKLDSKR